jgi:hypothetical protein
VGISIPLVGGPRRKGPSFVLENPSSEIGSEEEHMKKNI